MYMRRGLNQHVNQPPDCSTLPHLVMHGVLHIFGTQLAPLVLEAVQVLHQPLAQCLGVCTRKDVPQGTCLSVPAEQQHSAA